MPLTTVPNIHICSVGHWDAMTGPWDCTPDDLASMVQASQSGAVRLPVVKLGHIDPRFDGQPAVGRLTNLRTSDDGMELYADAEGVPEWLADCWASAFPSRSIEAALDCTDAQGHKHKAILTGLALLGVQAPAIESLDDIRALYDGELVAASVLMAQGTAIHYQPDEERPMSLWERIKVKAKLGRKVQASVAIDCVYDAFYEAIPAGSYAWIRQVFSDYVLADDGDGHMYQVPWTEEPEGEVTFGDPVSGRMVFVPDTEADSGEQGGIALAGEREGAAALLAHDPNAPDPIRVAAGAPSTPTDQEVDLDIQELMAEVGLPADATAEQYRERLTELASIAAAGEPTPTTTTEPAPTAPVLPEGVVVLDEAVHQELVSAARTLRENRRTEAIDGAVKLGKISPARRDHWLASWDADPEGTEATLSSLESGLVPVSVSAGHAGGGHDEGGDDAFYKGLFGDESGGA